MSGVISHEVVVGLGVTAVPVTCILLREEGWWGDTVCRRGYRVRGVYRDELPSPREIETIEREREIKLQQQ